MGPGAVELSTRPIMGTSGGPELPDGVPGPPPLSTLTAGGGPPGLSVVGELPPVGLLGGDDGQTEDPEAASDQQACTDDKDGPAISQLRSAMDNSALAGRFPNSLTFQLQPNLCGLSLEPRRTGHNVQTCHYALCDTWGMPAYAWRSKLGAFGTCPELEQATSVAVAIGNENLKIDPRPSWDRTPTVPPCC
jgi:hypothetical protein